MISNKLVPVKPFSHPQSEKYFDAIKRNNYEEVKLLVDLNWCLVYEFDKQKQTGLHWAAKRGYTNILLYLIKHNANINSKDVLGRTPLWVACRYNRTQEVRLLLSNRASSFIKCNRKLSPQDVTTDDKIQQLVEKGKIVQVIMKFIPVLKRKDVLNELGLGYFLKDLNLTIN